MQKLYPSIPHLPGSRAARDRQLSADSKEARLCIGPAWRDAELFDVIVQEKLDGSCVAVTRENAQLVARGREGRLASESGNEARRQFAVWVADNAARFDGVVAEGEVLAGEWLLLVHGTEYELTHELFVPFDLLRDRDKKRASVDELAARIAKTGLVMPAIVHRGGPIAIAAACTLLGERGKHGAKGPPEGLVYRVESKQDRRVFVVAKWVREDKVDGALLPENSGQDARYHQGRPPR